MAKKTNNNHNTQRSFKDMLLKAAEEVEDTINRLRAIQKEIHDRAFGLSPEELEKEKQDPENLALLEKIENLINTLWD